MADRSRNVSGQNSECEKSIVMEDNYFKTLESESKICSEITRPLTAHSRPAKSLLNYRKSRKMTTLSENYLNTYSETAISHYIHSIDA